MLIAVLSGFATALLLLAGGRYTRGKGAYLLAVLPLVLFAYFLSLAPAIAAGEQLAYEYSWIPSMGINLSFYLDGLSLLFALVITGIGFLVYVYAAEYLAGHPYLDRFFGYLSMFMASMLGLVLSDNILSLFVFWELTSISSFFLIGFKNEDKAARKSSILALAVTGGGGFLLLAGFILLNNISGTYSIQEMLGDNEVLKQHSLYWLVLVLLFAGAFTKSAQFPFHFWLPGAMKAPTPVSAYLHSATMVKAGIYLLARFTPVLGGHDYWNITLMVVGGITMLYSAFHAVFRTDLKAILAYSTIAGLGMLVFLLGIGTQKALVAVAVFILVHALYKAGLFLVAGIIDHATGSRDVTVLKGLRKLMMPVALAGALAAVSNAGIPFTFGFLGKDLVYEATLDTGTMQVLFTAAAVLTNALLLYAGFVTGIKPFLGSLPPSLEKAHLPGIAMWMPPLLLGIGGLLFGMFPGLIDGSLLQPVLSSLQRSATWIPLKIWHGFNLVLLLSMITLAAGILLYIVYKPSQQRMHRLNQFNRASPENLIVSIARGTGRFSGWYTNFLQHGYLRWYLMTILLFLVSLLAYKVFIGVEVYVDSSQFSELTIYEVMTASLMLVSIVISCIARSRLTAVASMGVVGYCLCLLFVFYSAPDLAMTQFTIDTLTVVLFVLVLFKLPHFVQFADKWIKMRDAIFGLMFGSLITIISLEVLNETVEKDVSAYYGANAYELAKGKNVVNVILVDFRGIDTLVEITVLAIAAIGVFSLLSFRILPEKFIINEDDYTKDSV